MNILYVCQDYGIPVLGNKGASVHVREMISAMRRAGHQVVLVSPSATRGVWNDPAAVDARFLHIPASDDILAAVQAAESYATELDANDGLARDLRRILYDRYLQGKLLRKFAKSPPDFIYVRAALHSVAPLALARETGRPLLVELNAPLVAENQAYRDGATAELARAAECSLLQAADAVLVVSAQLVDHAIACGARPEQVHVIANAVDPELFHPAQADPRLRAAYGIGDGPVLGFVGGLRQWHGVEALPELLQKLTDSHPDARLVIVGSGPLESTLKQRLADLCLGERAIFTGALEHAAVARLIREFDIALAPYPELDHEFYFSPLKLFEYMACGIPVVAANTGQIGEIVVHGSTGLLYPPGNFDELVRCCSDLLGKPSQARVIGSAAADEISQNYTWAGNAARVVEIAQRAGAQSWH